MVNKDYHSIRFLLEDERTHH